MELALLKPRVLNGVIRELEAPQELQGVRLLPTRGNPFASVEYDVTRGSRLMSKPNVPNAEAHIVPKLGVGRLNASYFYVREKKVFEPTTLYWLRQPGTENQKRAEAAVIAELQDLNDRVTRFQEYCIWRGMFTGRIEINEPDVKASVDYGIADSHRPVFSGVNAWDYKDGSGVYTAPVREQINAIKRLTSRDGGAQITDAWLNNTTMDMLMRNQLFQGAFLSDRQKDAFLTTSTIPGLYGINWHEYDLHYGDDTGQLLPYIPDGVVVFIASGGDPFVMFEGPTADFSADPNHLGRFAKTWQEQDPSARQALVEMNFFPVLFKPDQVVYAKVF